MTQTINDTIELEHITLPIRTENEIRTHLLKCADKKDGYLHFAKNFFHMPHPVKGKIQFDPHLYQTNLLRSMHDYRYSIGELPRQSGKTTNEAVYLLWYAMFVPNSTIRIATHSYSSAQEIMIRILYAYESCPDYIRAGVTSNNKASMSFDNGSIIQAETFSETTGRGMKLSILCLDEYALVPSDVAGPNWDTITSNTINKVIIIGTDRDDGNENHFSQIFKGSQDFSHKIGEVNSNGIGRNGFHGYRVQW